MQQNHGITKEKRIDLIRIIENRWNECNNTIDKENDLLTRINNKIHVLALLKDQSGHLQSSSAQCIQIIESYNKFEENNLKYIQSIKIYFDKKWMEFESKWWKWDVVDVISWFRYKTIGMDTTNINWKLSKDEMTKRNINGKSLEHFNDSRLDMIGLHDFKISVYLMEQIATLRTKYRHTKDCGEDSKNEDDDIDNTMENEVPSKFKCPLTKRIMKDPVIAFDENVYEREAIEKHLKEKGTSPMTGDKAFVVKVFANKELKKEIEAYCMVNNIDPDDFDTSEGSMVIDTAPDAGKI